MVFHDINGDCSVSPNVAVIITDGQSNNNTQTVQEAAIAKNMGIHIVTIGVGMTDMTNFASAPPAVCCGNKSYHTAVVLGYNLATEMCCNGNIQPKAYHLSCCCGSHAINAANYTCCGGVPIPTPPSDTSNCCRKRIFFLSV